MKNLIALLVISLLYGCQNYSFSLNDNELYSPRPLFKGYAISDAQLASCVQQAIKDQAVRDASELTKLHCSYAGIQSIDGIEIFYKLQSLSFANNQLRDISVLMQLSDLKLLDVSHNNLDSAQRLLDLPHLENLNLDGNKALNCDLDQRPNTIEIRLPEHCLER